MKAKVLSVILTYVNLLHIQGLDLKNSNENDATESNRRVLFGEPANVSDFPFIVAMIIADALCGGTIIADRWVLSAAHCVHKQNCSMIEIIPGISEQKKGVRAVECHVHPNYTFTRYPYDISLLKVNESFLQDGRAQAIPLPAPGTVFPRGTAAVIAGWGRTENNIFPNILLRADLRVEDWDVCNIKFKQTVQQCRSDSDCNPEDIPRRILCTQGNGSSLSGSCFGDSGGPVTINGSIAGIVSFGIADEEGHCRIGFPSLHTSVVDYLPWIYSFIDPDMDTSGMQVRPEY